MLTYAAAIVFTCTYLKILPTTTKLLVLGEVFLSSCLIPVLFIWVLYKMKVVGHWALRDRADRALPLFVNAVSYAFCAWTLYEQGMPNWALAFYVGATALAFICWIISFWWKVSAHAAGIAGLTTVTYLLHIANPVTLPLALPLLLTVATGLLCSIRVYLGRHTLAQVTVGTLLGIAVILAAHFLMM
jgi:membrane-associated phospholipid phosphatase